MTIKYGISRVMSSGPRFNETVEFKDCPEHGMFDTYGEARKRAVELGNEYAAYELRVG